MAFTDAERLDVFRFCGYGAPEGFGFILGGTWQATLSRQMDAASDVTLALVRTKFLAVLPGLETAIVAAGDNLDTDQAAVWKHNRDEVAQRQALFDSRRRALCAVFMVPAGPGLRCGGVVRG